MENTPIQLWLFADADDPKQHTPVIKGICFSCGRNRIIFIGKGPRLVDGIEQELLLPEGITFVKSVKAAIDKLDSLYPERVRIIDKASQKNAEKVICHIRNTKDGRFAFIANTDEKREVEIEVSIPEKRTPYLFDPMKGLVYRIPFESSNGRTSIVCTLHPAGSMFIIFSAEKVQADEAPVYLQTGIEFKHDLRLVDKVSNWSIGILEENALPIYHADFYAGDKKILSNQHIAYAQHNVFDKLDDGTPIRIEYSFNVRSMPDSPLTAIVEMAENYDKITLNGHELKPLKKPGENGAFKEASSWKDVNFTRVPLNDWVVAGRCAHAGRKKGQ